MGNFKTNSKSFTAKKYSSTLSAKYLMSYCDSCLNEPCHPQVIKREKEIFMLECIYLLISNIVFTCFVSFCFVCGLFCFVVEFFPGTFLKLCLGYSH